MDYFHLSFPSSICSRSSCFGVVFSIGLFMLNQDGTLIVDDNTGQPIPTYTNKDVMNFARGFTNFAHQGNVRHNVHLIALLKPSTSSLLIFCTLEDQRDNIEAEWSLAWISNAVDPMYLPSSEGRVRISLVLSFQISSTCIYNLFYWPSRIFFQSKH